MSKPSVSSSFQNATGDIRYGMTNDYMFRAVLQENNDVLVALICSVLHIPENAVHSASIMNPIILGQHIDEKTVILDVKVMFDNSSVINLEMQVANEHDWEKRSLYYLCRNYSALKSGETYLDARPVIHIGFLDFQLFDDENAFLSDYFLMNPVSCKIYSDNIRLSVLNLNRINDATSEDRFYGIDRWARLFKAKTWEEIRMLAKNDSIIEKAATSIYDLSADEAIALECEARADYERRQKGIQQTIDRYKKERDVFAKERDAFAKERDAFAKERDAAVKKVDAMQKRIAELESRLEVQSHKDGSKEKSV